MAPAGFLLLLNSNFCIFKRFYVSMYYNVENKQWYWGVIHNKELLYGLEIVNTNIHSVKNVSTRNHLQYRYAINICGTSRLLIASKLQFFHLFSFGRRYSGEFAKTSKNVMSIWLFVCESVWFMKEHTEKPGNFVTF